MLYQTSGMISSPCWKVGTEHRHYFVLKLAWHPRFKKPSPVCEHFLNSMIYKHSFRSGSQKGQARTQLQTKSFNLSLMLVGELWDLNSASGKANLLNLHDLCQTILGKGQDMPTPMDVDGHHGTSSPRAVLQRGLQRPSSKAKHTESSGWIHRKSQRDLRGPVGIPPASDSDIITLHFLKIKYKNMINP